MSESIEQIITRLENGENAPNLCNLWINYLKLKKSYEKALVQAEYGK